MDHTEQEACMPLEDCRRLLVELQELRLRISALEHSVADFVNKADAEPDQTG
jgi:hypothetical protein